MTVPGAIPIEALEKVFHEPSRLAIMSALAASDDPLPFTQLRDACQLTDGNLNRHLKVLHEAGVISITKAFIDDKPRTTVALSKTGLLRFGQYLDALGAVLEAARAAISAATADSTPVSGQVRTATA